MAFSSSLKKHLVCGTAFAALLGAVPAAAQVSTDDTTQEAATPTTAAPQTDADEGDGKGTEILVTGSRIRQDPNNSALPLQIVTTQELQRNGISSPEQLIMFLSTNGSGADNLASNGDVVAGAARGGNNGLSSANLRGQGPAATLVLLNGRRVAAHGIGGGSVDVNQIPFAAIERVEVLKDGASAIYGTDAIGGVINFITKKDFQGVGLSAFTDITQEGDAPIYRLSGTVGYGDLDEEGFNIMGAVSKSWNGVLYGRDRDFVNGNQPNRGLAVDTRGTPIATAFPINNTAAGIGITQNGTLLGSTTQCNSGSVANNNCVPNPLYLNNLLIPGTALRADGGINTLNLPGGAGCDSFDGGMPYDYALWGVAGARYACAYDTGRAAVLQQPIETLTYYGRGTAKLGEHELFAEVTGSKATSHKRFSENQYTASATAMPIAYPLNGLTAATYNTVYDQIAAVFPAIGTVGDRTVDAVGNYGKPIAFRYRCIECGLREYTTDTKTFRAAIGAEGPLFGDFDYRAGATYARSESSSVLGTGYHYRGVFASNATALASGTGATLAGQADPRAPTAPGATAPGIVGLFNSGIINPFSITQSAAALAGLEAVSAYGTTLYGGRYEVKQGDASISGPLFGLPGGQVQVAVGVDYRKETYSFNGSAAAAANQPDIFNVAFDNVNALTPKNRDVKAAYAELLVPIFTWLELSGAVRIDDYSGFGTTTNPKITAKFRPVDWLMFRGSYNTGFRVPAFNQIFNGVTQTPNPGNARADPTTCPAGGTINVTPGCSAITPDSLSGGNLNLGPETSKQWSTGVVFQPISNFSASVDYWNIAVDNTIGALTIDQLLNNQSSFPDRVTRTNGVITLLDVRADNIGSRRTAGLEVTLRGNIDAFGGTFVAGLDGTRLLKKREKLLPSSPYGPSLIGVFAFGRDPGIKWKHNAFVSWANEDVTLSLSQIFRQGYRNYQISAVGGARPDYNKFVKDYITYNASVSYTGLGPNYKLTAGIRNLLNTDPPFAITYNTDTGGGSSWDPQVADPRGRSFTVAVETKF